MGSVAYKYELSCFEWDWWYNAHKDISTLFDSNIIPWVYKEIVRWPLGNPGNHGFFSPGNSLKNRRLDYSNFYQKVARCERYCTQLPEKYKQNFDDWSEGPSNFETSKFHLYFWGSCIFFTCQLSVISYIYLHWHRARWLRNYCKARSPLGKCFRATRSEKQILAMWLVSEKIRREKVGSVPTFLLFARKNSPSGERT